MTYYKAKSEYIIREFLDDTILIPVGSQIIKNNSIIVLNETSLFMWKALSQPKTFDALAQEMMAEYEVEKDVLTPDIKAFIDYLSRFDALEITEE